MGEAARPLSIREHAGLGTSGIPMSAPSLSSLSACIEGRSVVTSMRYLLARLPDLGEPVSRRDGGMDSPEWGMKTRSRGRGRMAGAGSIKGPSPDARRRARLPKSVMRIAIGPPRWLKARSIRLPSASGFGRLLLAERDWPLPKPLDAAMRASKIGGKSGRCWLLRPSHAD